MTHYDMAENNSRTNLWLLATDGSAQRQLTRGKNDGEPQFSPDGGSIAFVATPTMSRMPSRPATCT